MQFGNIGILRTYLGNEIAQVNFAIEKILIVEVTVWVSVSLVLVFVFKFLQFFLKGLVFFALLVNSEGLFVRKLLLVSFFFELVV